MKAIAVAAVVVALALPLAGSTQAAPLKRTALLRLVTVHPILLRGSRFLAGERVRVVVHSNGSTRARALAAGPRGGFRVRFAGMPFDRCDGLLARARGSRGSIATFKLPDVACPPRG